MKPRCRACPMVGGGIVLNPSIRWSGTRVRCSIAMLLKLLRLPLRLGEGWGQGSYSPGLPTDALRRRLGVVAQHPQQVGHPDRAEPLLHDLGRSGVPLEGAGILLRG